jgi:hypothetical protein
MSASEVRKLTMQARRAKRRVDHRIGEKRFLRFARPADSNS